MIQDNINEHIKDVKKDFESYLEKRIDLFKLHLVEELSRFTAGFALKLGIMYLLLFVLLFISLAGALFLGELLGSYGWGFAIVAGFYLLLVLVFSFLRRTCIERPLIRTFIRMFFPKLDGDE